MVSPEMRATHTVPDSLEARHLRAKSSDELADIILDSAQSEMTNLPDRIIGYVPAGQPIVTENVVQTEALLDKLKSLQFERRYKRNVLSCIALTLTINKLTQETAIPGGARVITEGSRYIYTQQPGPQLTNADAAFWALSIRQDAWMYEDDDETMAEVPSSRTNHITVSEVYGDADGAVKHRSDFDEQELHERLVFIATSSDGQPHKD